MNAAAEIRDEQLHAYVDGRLDAADGERVAAWLLAHPAQAERIRAWQTQRQALRAAFDPVVDEPLPARLLQAAQAAAPAQRRLFRLAAGAAWMTLGGLIGYGLGAWPSTREAGPPPIARSAAVAHVVYSPEVRHPVEVGADQEAHLVQWLSKRLGLPLRIPHLADRGYALVGGRLLPGDQGPVAQFMYQDAGGRRLTLYVRTDATENHETAFRYQLEGKVGVFYWLDGKLGYALSAELPREQLLGLAESAYKQLNP